MASTASRAANGGGLRPVDVEQLSLLSRVSPSASPKVDWYAEIAKRGFVDIETPGSKLLARGCAPSHLRDLAPYPGGQYQRMLDHQRWHYYLRRAIEAGWCRTRVERTIVQQTADGRPSGDIAVDLHVGKRKVLSVVWRMVRRGMAEDAASETDTELSSAAAERKRILAILAEESDAAMVAPTRAGRAIARTLRDIIERIEKT